MKKGGFALGGLILLVIGTRSNDSILTGLALTTAVACAVVLARQKGLYVKALAQRISLDPKDRAISGHLDADARGLLMEELFSPETHRVLNALELLRQDETFDVRPFLRTLLDHPSERVREVGVRLARQTKATELAPKLVAIAETDKDRRPRDEAVRALAAVLPEAEAVSRLRVFLTASDPGLRAAATEALFRLGGAPKLEAESALSDALTGTSPAERREAARLLGRLRTPDAAKRLLIHFGDEDASVRNVACAAAAELKDPILIEPLFDLLPPRATRRSAREALIAYGPAVLPGARARLDDRNYALSLRLEMPKLLRAIGTEQAAEILLFSNIDDDAFLRYRIGIALSRWRAQNPTLAVDQQRVREAIHRRIVSYAAYSPIHADVTAALGADALLSRALAGRLVQNVELVFQLLGLIYPQRMLLSAYRRFVSNEGRERAQAVELIDSLIDDTLRREILPTLEAEIARRLGAGLAGDASAAPARLVDLTNSRDIILQGLAWQASKVAPGDRAGATVSTLGLEKVLLLEGVDIFAGCSVDDLTALAQIAGERNFKEGEFIYSEGDSGETLYVIVDGRVRILKSGTVVLRLASREAFGSVSLLDGAPRPADAVAETAVRTLAIDRGDFLDLVSDRPELLKGVFNVVTGQLRRMIDVAARANATAA
jgi:HEAT repeat protein